MIDENMIYEAQRMLHERCMYYKQAANKSTNKEFKIHCGFSAFAYKSACDILLAAVQGNAEILKEFDYFGTEEDENDNHYDTQELLESGYHFVNGEPVMPPDEEVKSLFIKSWRPGEPLEEEEEEECFEPGRPVINMFELNP